MGSFRLTTKIPRLNEKLNLIGSFLETVGRSLCRSCRSEFTRQRISLPLDRYSYSRRLQQNILSARHLHLTKSTGQTSNPIRHYIQQSSVFLLNSRRPPFSATVYGTSYSQITKQICRVPSEKLNHILVFSTQLPESVLVRFIFSCIFI